MRIRTKLNWFIDIFSKWLTSNGIQVTECSTSHGFSNHPYAFFYLKDAILPQKWKDIEAKLAESSIKPDPDGRATPGYFITGYHLNKNNGEIAVFLDLNLIK